MTRKKPPKPPEITQSERPGWVKETRRYKVITPLYGGGTTPGEADPVTVVRATEVRGHLRFWWRATRGGIHGNNLKATEEEIWGSAGQEGGSRPSSVIIRLVSSKKGTDFQATDRQGQNIAIGHPRSKDSYVAFALREKINAVVRENVEFVLQIEYPVSTGQLDVAKEVSTALWAWETFGGIGARTRRGFGALQCTEVNNATVPAPTWQEVQEAIQGNMLPDVHWPAGVPHLPQSAKRCKVITRRPPTDTISVWRNLIKQLQDFRQLRNGRFGRSLWPEADSIRRKTGDSLNPNHAPRHPVDKFPRAKFGLPIIFEFKGEDVANGDPRKTTLQGAEHDRLASPLILRPLVCSDGVVGLALILDWEPVGSTEDYTPPGGLVLTGSDYPNFAVESDLSTGEAAHIPVLEGNPDILQAFLDSLK